MFREVDGVIHYRYARGYISTKIRVLPDQYPRVTLATVHVGNVVVEMGADVPICRELV